MSKKLKKELKDQEKYYAYGKGLLSNLKKKDGNDCDEFGKISDVLNKDEEECYGCATQRYACEHDKPKEGEK